MLDLAMGYIDDIMNTPADNLLVGTMETRDEEGKVTSNVIIDGTPAGFRMLAGVLSRMADSVEKMTAEAGSEDAKGWGLVLHPDDIPALGVLGVKSLSLACKPVGSTIVPDS